jgi:death-on-curing protein
MIDIKTVESIHNILIERFGGSKGIRDMGSLKAAFSTTISHF